MSILIFTALGFAALESLALLRQRRDLEYLAKPAVMLCLFAWLWASTALRGPALWFGFGLLFSLAGDVLLMISLERMFLPGLAAFLLAHAAYVIGFNLPLPEFSAWGLFMALIIGLGGLRLIRRILVPLEAAGQARLRLPIAVYGAVISIMLLSAMMKLSDLTWDAAAAVWVGSGALLFYISDILLAWNRFVTPIRHGRIYNIGAYHLGQIALIAGIGLQFGG
jgi:uncharacterized membrane protein YhhN